MSSEKEENTSDCFDLPELEGCMSENSDDCAHLALIPEKNNEQKTKLRFDGTYVQFGRIPWENDAFYSSPEELERQRTKRTCWYNIVRIIDEETVYIVGGIGMHDDHCFYEYDVDYEKEVVLVLFSKCRVCESPESYGEDDECYCKKFAGLEDKEDKENLTYHHLPISILERVGFKEYMSRFGINNISDPIDTARSVSKLSGEEISMLPNTGHWNLTTPIGGSNMCECTSYDDDALGWCQADCNDDFTFYYQHVPLIMYDCGSPCRGNTINYPMYFVPSDLSLPEIWRDSYERWLSHREICIASLAI